MKKPHRNLSLSPILLPAALAAFLGACSSDPADEGDGDTSGDGDGEEWLFCAPADTCPPNLDGYNEATPVSFRTDIYEAYFRDSCGGGSGCHGKEGTAATGLYFGNATTPLDDAGITMLIAQLIGDTPEIAPTEKNVVPGNWQDSWLMSKLDGCQADYGVTCDAEAESLILSACKQPCGDGMPASEGDTSNPNAFPAEASMRHKVRAWIAQGALDN